MKLKGKIAAITGGSAGIGLAIAIAFLREGASVVIMARDAAKGAAAVEQLGGDERSVFIKGDATVQADIERFVDGTIERFGRIDILVNNAGASAAMGLELADDDLWLADFNLKVMAAVRLSRLIIPSMKVRGGGAIINASIGGGKAPNAGSLPTSVMRSAGLNLTKSLAQEFAASGIRVNAICIGFLKSMQWVRRSDDSDPSAIYDSFAQKIPMGRVGEAEEYADLVAFLSSARASYITGTAINLDGGLCPVL